MTLKAKLDRIIQEIPIEKEVIARLFDEYIHLYGAFDGPRLCRDTLIFALENNISIDESSEVTFMVNSLRSSRKG